MQKVRAAVIGLGTWGVSHAEALASMPEAELVAVCDARPGRAQEIAAHFDVAGRYESPEALWQRDDVDLVSIVTPEAAHLPLVLAALESEKHVLVEKPAATSAAEARQMAEAAQQTGRYLMPGHILRFDPRYAAVRSAIEAGEIGAVASIFSKRTRPRSLFPLYKRTHLAFVTTIHDIDLALWYSSSRVRCVRAQQRHVMGDEAPDLLWATLEFENGTIAVLHSSWLVPDDARIDMVDQLEVTCTNGLLRVDPSGRGFEQCSTQGNLSPAPSVHNQPADGLMGPLCSELGYLCGCILRGQPPERVPFSDAIQGLQVAEAIVQSAASGEIVSIENA